MSDSHEPKGIFGSPAIILMVVGALVIAASVAIGGIWVETSASHDTDEAVHRVSLFYLGELAGRREQVIASNLDNCIEEINAAISLMNAETLQDQEHLASYQAQVKKYYNLDKFAFVDEAGTIYTSRGTQTNLDEYDFDPFTLTEPSVSLYDNTEDGKKKVVIAAPADIALGDSKLVCCFMEIDMDKMLKGVSMESDKDGITYCNLYTTDGQPLADTVIGGETSSTNILEALESATFADGGSLEQVKTDFAEGTAREVTFDYNGSREMLSYVPVEKTSWMLTYLMSESIISEEVGQISDNIVRRTFIQSAVTASVILLLSILIILQNRRSARMVLETETKAAEDRARNEELEKTVELQQQLLEQEKDRQEAIELITALSSDYWSVYYIELDKNEGVCYQARTDIADSLKRGQHFGYLESCRRYAETYVTEPYREEFLAFIDPTFVRDSLSDKRIISYRYMVNHDGQETYEMLRFAGVRHPEDRSDNKVHSVGACFVDVDDETRDAMAKSQALSDALDAAEKANIAKTSFLSSMSHEIRTPMNAIIGLDNIALNDETISPQTREYLEKIGMSAAHLLALINDILDMSRIESGRMILKNEEFSLRRLLEVINTMFASQCQDKGLEYSCHILGDIDEYYIGDNMKLRQVLINILGNSVKFTPTGGSVNMTVEKVGSYEDHTTVRFTISDTGIGMSKEFLPHIFDTFSQEDSSNTNRYGSSGLGMAITKSIVEMMNGEITVESEKGQGTTFYVLVTLQNSQHEGEIADIEVDIHSLSVLIVDDDEVALEHARLVLESAGIAADVTDSAQKAVEMVKVRTARSAPYNLILLDWQMPVMDGVECARQIRSITGDMSAIIMLTAYRWDDVQEEAVLAGIDSFIAKPLFVGNVLDEYRSAAAKKGLASMQKKDKADLEGRRMLLAEDVEINAEIMVMLLEMREVECEIAANGRIALEMFEQSEPGYYDAILMDVRMPEMDGLEATRRIRSLPREDARSIPIIALTANAFDEDVQRSLQAGLNAHLSKPVDPDVLFETLENLL